MQRGIYLFLLFLIQVSTFAQKTIDRDIIEGEWVKVDRKDIGFTINVKSPNRYGITTESCIQNYREAIDGGEYDDLMPERIVMYSDLDEAIESDDIDAWYYMGSDQVASMQFEDGHPKYLRIVQEITEDYMLFRFRISAEYVLPQEVYDKDPAYADETIKDAQIIVRFNKKKM